MLGSKCTQFGIIKKINRRENANCPTTEKGKSKAINTECSITGLSTVTTTEVSIRKVVAECDCYIWKLEFN